MSLPGGWSLMRGFGRMGRTALQRIAATITPAKLELQKAIVVRDLLAVGMYVVVIAVPHLDVLGAFTLLHDLVERCQRGGEVVDRDDAASTPERCVRDLASRVPVKHARLAAIRA